MNLLFISITMLWASFVVPILWLGWKKLQYPYMTRTIYDCWAKPKLGLSAQFGKAWDGRAVGDTDEQMPLDNSLNEDIHQSARMHVVISRSGIKYGDKDP